MNTPPPPPPSAPPPPPPLGGFGEMPGQPASPTGQPLAEPWMRIVARVLDYVLPSLVFGFIFAGLVLSSEGDAGVGGFGADADFAHLYLYTLLGVGVSFLWDGVMVKLFGGSPMKLAFGMRVVRADTGGPVEWSHAIIRWAVAGALPLIPLPILPGIARIVIAIIGVVFLFTKPLRQTVSDLAAKTLVVSIR